MDKCPQKINELVATKPVSLWFKEIKVEPKKIFSGIAKTILKGASLDVAGAGESALDVIDAAGL